MNERTEGSGKPRSGRGQKISRGSQAVRGFNPRDLAGEANRFWVKVNKRRGGCWLWTGAKKRGWGRFRVWRGRWTHIPAHRWAYEAAHGPIPDGIYLDHTCHTDDLDCPGGDDCPHRPCVRPSHLEPVSDEENGRRARTRRRT